ncbi:MAG: phosphate ABC transporter permease PstA [Candidatus Caenarcaniphilales bacterium]|nr:phosphate ABC transporter permease PstA [Candidatus Caenarcaniphilales bacterium]
MLLSYKPTISSGQNKAIEQIGFFFLRLAAVLVLVILAWTIWYIFSRGLGMALTPSYLFDPPQGGRNDQGGILYPLLGTLYIVGFSVLLAAPVGVFAAIYLAEFADPKARLIKMARFAIESLAGIPSVIFGLFGLAFFVTFFAFRQSLLAGAMSVAIMILPFIIRTAEEAILSIPRSLRDASLALGADQVQTILRVVLPSAMPAITSGIMLGIGRAIAESAVLILAAGGNITSAPRLFSTDFPYILPDSGRTLAVHLYYQATSYDNVERAFATAVVLILIILGVNSFIWFRKPRSLSARK